VRLYIDTESSNVDRYVYLSEIDPIRLTREIDGRGALQFKMRGSYTTLSNDLQPGLGVNLEYPNGTSIFCGVIDTVDETEATIISTQFDVWYTVNCISYASWLDRRIVRKVWENTTVGEILDDLFADYWTAEGFSEGTITSTVHDTTLDKIECIYQPSSYVLDQIGRLTNSQWRVNPDKSIDVRSGSDYGTIAGGKPSDYRNLRVHRDRDRYINKVYVVSPTNVITDEFTGDASTQTFYTKYKIISPVHVYVADEDGNNRYKRRASTDYDDTITIASAIAGASESFSNQPGDLGDTIKIKSTDVSDTSDVTIIYEDMSGQVTTQTVSLNGTTLVTFPEIARYIYAAYVEDIAYGNITVYRNDGTTAICTISSGTSSIGVEPVSDSDDIFIKPYVVSQAGNTGAIAILSELPSGSTLYQAVDLNGTTDVYFGTVCKSVQEVYTGLYSSSYTATITCQYEWEYTEDSRQIDQNTNLDDLSQPIVNKVAADEKLQIEYRGLYRDEIATTISAEVTARAAQEGGTGKYEHAEKVDEHLTYSQANALATGLLSHYCREDTTSFFPRVQIEFETRDSDFAIPGQQFTDSFPKHRLTDETFTITSTEMIGLPVSDASAYKWLYRVTAVTGTPIGDWARRFQDMLPIQRQLQK